MQPKTGAPSRHGPCWYPPLVTTLAAAIALLAGALALPAPETDSRERDFCRAWLALSAPEKDGVLSAAERDEPASGWDAECRQGMRSGLRRTLDSECRNWSKLMDFEVRLVVDRLLDACRAPDPGGPPR